jgi:hypothetical protein
METAEREVNRKKKCARESARKDELLRNVGWTDAARAGAYISRMRKLHSGFVVRPVSEVIAGTNPVRQIRSGIQGVVIREPPKVAVVPRSVTRQEFLNPGQWAKLKALEAAGIARWSSPKKQRFNDQRPPSVGWVDPLDK